MFSVTIDVEPLDARRDLHRRVVDQHVLDLHLWIRRRDFVDDSPPHPRRLQTFALSTEVRSPRRAFARRNARRTIRSTCLGWYSHWS